jgi:ABC-type Fe3+-citrate transport system substrate-binding protein
MGQSALGGEATFAETQSNGQDAPISAIDLEQCATIDPNLMVITSFLLNSDL